MNEARQDIIKASVMIENPDTSKTEIDVDLNFILGNFDPVEHHDFVEIDEAHADRAKLYLQKETYESFKKMHEAAKANHIILIIKSATRNFEYQKRIWERKWNGETKVEGEDLSKTIADPVKRAKKILEFSSMPGSSRHHWGTDIDLNSFDNEWFETGEGLKIFQWLEKNANEYGFCRPYTVKDEERLTGYNEEKWHWSYMPLSRPYSQLAKDRMTDEMIAGFAGAESAKEVGIVKNYVLGINKACL